MLKSLILLSILLPFVLSLSCIADFDWVKHETEVLSKIIEKNGQYNKSTELNEIELYDFVVAGAGPAGSTLVAKLLKENPKLRILLIEAGTPAQDERICDYRQATQLLESKYDWNYPTTFQKNLNRTVYLNAGRGLGGGSLINAMFWVRGHPYDYDDWADMVDDQTWNYENLLPIFKEIETVVNGSAERGTDGDVYATQEFSKTEICKAYLNASLSLGYKYNPDANSESNFGASFMEINVRPIDVNDAKKGGVRQDGFSTQLHKYLGKSNLHILTETRAVRVELDENKSVKYLVFDKKGVQYRIRAKYETILSSGALESPLILMRSGIGNCDELKELGIECVLDLPYVGKNLQDHPGMRLFRKIEGEIPKENILLQIFNGTVTTKGQKRPKPEFHLASYYMVGYPYGKPDYFLYLIIFLHETSRGSVKLNSTNVYDIPIIDINWFDTEEDRESFLRGFRELFQLGLTFKNSPLGKLKIGSTIDPEVDDNITDAEAIQFLRENLRTIYHYCGTCKMGKEDDKTAVVNSKLEVLGVKGLRVVDNSIMPEVTSGNTNYPAFMIGAKAAKMILEKGYFKTDL